MNPRTSPTAKESVMPRELVLESKRQQNETPTFGNVMLSPELGEDYWEYRVLLSDKQAIVGFPKFLTIGIGFAVEGEDWNTNLPYTCDAVEIYRHVQENKGDDSISSDDCIRAIEMIQDAVRRDRGEVDGAA